MKKSLKKSKKEVEKELKKYKINLVFAFITIFLLIVLLILFNGRLIYTYYFGEEYKQLDNPFDSVRIHYSENLTQEQVDKFNKMFEKVKVLYLSRTEDIYVVEKVPYCEDCMGRCTDNSVIEIMYMDDIEKMKEILTHELLHTFFENDGEDANEELTINHRIIYDMDNYKVAFLE